MKEYFQVLAFLFNVKENYVLFLTVIVCCVEKQQISKTSFTEVFSGKHDIVLEKHNAFENRSWKLYSKQTKDK